MDKKQVDLRQVGARPTEWTWTSAGNVTREQLGDALIIIRGQGNVAPQVDAVVLSRADGGAMLPEGPILPDDARTPSATKEIPPEAPDPSLPAVHSALTIDWSTGIADMPAMLWGANDYEIHQPGSAGDPGFNAFLKEMRPPIIRIHRGSFPREWLDAEQRHFDVEKIKAVFTAATGYGDTPIMLNISSWPAWMNEPGTRFIAAEHQDAYVAMCVELLRVMRDQVGRRVEYWEILNEKEGYYHKAHRLDELWRLYNRIVDAMRAEDPTAKFGGPAFTWANPQWVNSFVEQCLDRTDFVTYHNYGVGDIHDSNETLFSKLNTIDKHARLMRQIVDQASPDRRIPIYLSEYNVKWTWEPFERRHANNVGAAFHAGILNRIARAGIDGAMHWHIK
ncbi:MAG TPA: hypothetical protein PKB10_12045, partial [Tepidisphaeraceae bacterium]|nr:hypothetical protein [Tepidisphaeraceae bacterium]